MGYLQLMGTAQLDFHYYCCVLTRRSFYRPQRSCGKVMVSQASIILFTDTPLGRHSPVQIPPWADTRLGRHPPGRHLPPADGYCSRRYASYWNAFLFILDPHPIVFLRKTLGKVVLFKHICFNSMKQNKVSTGEKLI